ncbi:MAG: hypothetical protein WAK00_11920 [Microbacterium sp.]|uniref:hypothetical protein n=1 Tax=Microbacterium sp. TaxID=51671 RepID=UPI003BB1E84F
MSTDAHGNVHRPAGLDGAGQFTRKPVSAPEISLPIFDSARYDPEIVRSRRLLIDVITALSEHHEALTVLGAHGVIEMTQGVPDVPPDDSTRDGDLGVTPSLLMPLPRLGKVMESLGFEQEYGDRPGIWSPVSQRHLNIHQRDTVDLIAPFAVSYPEGTKKPRRGARVGDHGKNSVSATPGTELTTIDRRLVELRSFDDRPGVQAYVAAPAALLCAKAYKLHDRMDAAELARNSERLRPKDFADVYRLMLAIEPEDAADVFARGMATERIGEAVAAGRGYLIEVLSDEDYVASQVADAWQDVSRETEFAEFVASWRDRFAVR